MSFESLESGCENFGKLTQMQESFWLIDSTIGNNRRITWEVRVTWINADLIKFEIAPQIAEVTELRFIEDRILVKNISLRSHYFMTDSLGNVVVGSQIDFQNFLDSITCIEESDDRFS